MMAAMARDVEERYTSALVALSIEVFDGRRPTD
jgi:hypothetical protein